MNQNKLSFESENLQVDYLTFNIQGTPDFDLVNRIAKYLFQHFDFNSIISNCSKNKKHLFFSDKNRHQVEFALYLRAPELNSFWDGTQIRFSGKNAIRFYQLIQQQKINWHLFKTQNFKKHPYLTSFSVGSIRSQKWGQIRLFFKNLSFENRFSPQQAMLGTQWKFSSHFSPGARAFSQNPHISQNNE